MSFVANGVSIPSAIVLQSGDFFPAIALNDIRQSLRIDGSVTDVRLQQLTQEEMLDVNRLLHDLTLKHSSLQDVSKCKINDKSDVDILYFSAVSNGVYARLVEHYQKYDSSNVGLQKSDLLQQGVDDYRRNKHWAIQQLLGNPHTIVDLV